MVQDKVLSAAMAHGTIVPTSAWWKHTKENILQLSSSYMKCVWSTVCTARTHAERPNALVGEECIPWHLQSKSWPTCVKNASSFDAVA